MNNFLVDVKPLHEIETLDQERIDNPVAAQYRRAEEIVWARMEDYRKASITAARKDPDADQHILDMFAHEISLLVECDLNTKAEKYKHYLRTLQSR
jgi:uncharacterized protein YPO0396